jgi:four helix bundle protein
MHNFREIKSWQKSRIVVKDIYILSRKFPHEELYGLTSQIRRAAVSIPANIAEGSGRNTDKDFCKFLGYALASAYEVETELILAYDLGFISKEDVSAIGGKIQEVEKLIYGLIIKYEKEEKHKTKVERQKT